MAHLCSFPPWNTNASFEIGMEANSVPAQSLYKSQDVYVSRLPGRMRRNMAVYVLTVL